MIAYWSERINHIVELAEQTLSGLDCEIQVCADHQATDSDKDKADHAALQRARMYLQDGLNEIRYSRAELVAKG